jgi:hypothetical protein
MLAAQSDVELSMHYDPITHSMACQVYSGSRSGCVQPSWRSVQDRQ